MTLAPPPFLHESVVTCSASLKPLVLLYLLDRQVREGGRGQPGKMTGGQVREGGRGQPGKMTGGQLRQGAKGCVLCFTNSVESSQR